MSIQENPVFEHDAKLCLFYFVTIKPTKFFTIFEQGIL